MSGKGNKTRSANGSAHDVAPCTFDDLYSAFEGICRRAWEDGLAWHGAPRDAAYLTLPEGVFPALTQLMNPLTKTVVPVVRVPLCALAEAPSVAPSEETRKGLIALGWTPPAGDGQ